MYNCNENIQSGVLFVSNKLKNDVIGYNTDDKNVFNSVGNVYGDDLNVKFVKDPEKLLYQYDNLIRKIGKKYAWRFSNEVDRESLFAYIKETFCDLVVEYNPDSGVDFPGYIKHKLNYRVKKSYVNKIQPKKKPDNKNFPDVFLLADGQTTVEDLMNHKQVLNQSAHFNRKGRIVKLDLQNCQDESLLDIMDYLNRQDKLSLLDVKVIQCLATGNPDEDFLTKHVLMETQGYTQKDVHASYLKLKRNLKKYYYKYYDKK